MKKYLFGVVVVITMILAVTLSIQAQPPAGAGAGGAMGGGPGGGMGGGPGGGMGGGPGGGMGMGGMGMGGMDMGGMGMGMGMGPTQRPDKTARLKALDDLKKQVDALKAAIQKASDTDPCIAKLEGDGRTKFETQYNEERDALTQIVTTLNTIRPPVGGGMMMFMMMGRGGVGGLTSEQITELTTIAKGEKAPKTVAKLEALAKEAEAAASRGGMGGGMMGGGMMGGGMMGGGAPPAGGF
jgi:hypothetical protein